MLPGKRYYIEGKNVVSCYYCSYEAKDWKDASFFIYCRDRQFCCNDCLRSYSGIDNDEK